MPAIFPKRSTIAARSTTDGIVQRPIISTGSRTDTANASIWTRQLLDRAHKQAVVETSHLLVAAQ